MIGTLQNMRMSSTHRAAGDCRFREQRAGYAPQLTRARRCRVCERGSSISGGGERILQAAWKRLNPGTPVTGRNGDTYTVLYPGRPADGAGPDFRDAVMRGPDGAIMRGDVEIHVRSSGWRAHRHHLDPRYNGVAFHVTGPIGPFSGNGVPASTLSRRPLHLLVLGAAGQKSPDIENMDAALPEGIDADALAGAGDQRFLARSAGLSISLRVNGGDQAVWSAVLDCLGYSRNRRGFRRVAARLPWRELSEAMHSSVAAVESLMWAGGFGPKPTGLRDLASGGSVPDWTPGGRPDNRPDRRLLAAAILADRWRVEGPLNSVIEIVKTASGPKDLMRALGVNSPAGNEARTRALVGEGRAAEITVNAVLPLVHGWSLMADRWDIAEKAIRLYRDHPKLPSNAVTREMASLLNSGGGPLKIKGAREQQGLLLMYRAMTAGPVYALPPESEE